MEKSACITTNTCESDITKPPRMLLQPLGNCGRNFGNPFTRSQAARHDRRYRTSFPADDPIHISQGTAILTFGACDRVLAMNFICLSLVDDLQAFSSDVHLNFMRYAQFLCLRLVDDQERGDILAWGKKCRFPILRTNKKYWLDLSAQPIFVDIKIKNLVRQMRLLLSMLLRIPSGRPLFRLSDHGQISAGFSPLQNLILICEAFRIPVNCSNPFGTLNWTTRPRSITV